MSKPKRFLLFTGSSYYPLGGWDDLRGSFDTEEAARVASKAIGNDWDQVVDLETGEEVAEPTAHPPASTAAGS